MWLLTTCNAELATRGDDVKVLHGCIDRTGLNALVLLLRSTGNSLDAIVQMSQEYTGIGKAEVRSMKFLENLGP